MKPLNIGVFGSSYSRGNSEVIDPERPHAKVSVTGWPYELSKICEHQIYNHSIGGASVDFMIKQYWKQKHMNFDVCIFDAATMMRYTIEVKKPKMERQTPNYSEYTNENINAEILRYTASRDAVYSDEERASEHYQIWKDKLAFHEDQVRKDYLSSLKEIQKLADIIFFQCIGHYKRAYKTMEQTTDKWWTNPTREELDGIPIIEDLMPADLWEEYTIDQACHFNDFGSKWLARWMLKQIESQYA